MNLYKLHSRPDSLDHHGDSGDLFPEVFAATGTPDTFKIPKNPNKRQTTAISRNPLASVEYASRSGKRFPEGEPAILTSARASYFYADEILGKRWPEAEPIIMKDPVYAFLYSLNVIKGRWPEAEPAILENPLSAYEYSVDVIKGRWPEAEQVIQKDHNLWYSYHTVNDLL